MPEPKLSVTVVDREERSGQCAEFLRTVFIMNNGTWVWTLFAEPKSWTIYFFLSCFFFFLEYSWVGFSLSLGL